jgi:hypothetical protein
MLVLHTAVFATNPSRVNNFVIDVINALEVLSGRVMFVTPLKWSVAGRKTWLP